MSLEADRQQAEAGMAGITVIAYLFSDAMLSGRSTAPRPKKGVAESCARYGQPAIRDFLEYPPMASS
jgi:hypothetical protein